MRRSALGLVAALAAFPAQAQAPRIPPTHVMGEADNPNLENCRVSYGAIVNAIGAELQVMRVPVGSRQQSINGRALVMYVNANVAPLRFEGKSTTSCTGYVSIQLYVPRVIEDPVSGKDRRTSLTYCNEGFSLTSLRSEMQADINDRVRLLAAECINAYVQSEVGG